MGSVQLEFDLETYVDADYAHKAEMADGVKKALYVRGILAFLMSSLGSMSIGVYEDNKRAMDLAKKPLGSSNSKHIDVRHHMPGRWLPVVTSFLSSIRTSACRCPDESH